MFHLTVIKPYDDAETELRSALEKHQRREELSVTLLDSQAFSAAVSNQPISYALPPDTDVVIARMYSAFELERRGIPTVEVAMTGYDVIMAVTECIENYHPDKIAIFAPASALVEAKKLSAIYPQEIIFLESAGIGRLRDQMADAARLGVDAIIAGHAALRLAEGIGIPGTLIRSSESNFTRAIDEAIQIIEITRAETEKREQLQNILEFSFEGILSADEEGKIQLINHRARDFFGLREGQDVHISSLLPEVNYAAVLGGATVREEITQVGERVITYNAVPIRGEKENTGVVVTFQQADTIRNLEGKIRKQSHKKGFTARYRFSDIVTASPLMRECIETAERYSAVRSNVLLVGATGTGKELVAQSIHAGSPRSNGPFVAINCASLSESLLESELFGYVDGAFTGAAKGGKAGLFELAHNGTIFLDEIADISPRIQGELLRVIQEREIIRLGADRVTPIDVRIISATNQDLRKKAETGAFREDLLYRLDVLKLTLPPLRARGEDILLLAEHFIHNRDLGVPTKIRAISEEGRRVMLAYSWPGNIRELRNFCERLCVLCDTTIADAEVVRRAMERRSVDETPVPAQETLPDERERLVAALRRTNGSRRAAAEELGWSKSTLWRRMKRYGLL